MKEDETQMGIRFPDELYEKPESAITNEVEGKHGAGSFHPLSEHPQDTEKNQALEECLVELGRMPEFLSRRIGEVHTDGPIRLSPPQFTIDEIPETAESVAQGAAGYDEICCLKITDFMLSQKKKSGQKYTDETAMKRHSGNAYESPTVGNVEGKNHLQGML